MKFTVKNILSTVLAVLLFSAAFIYGWSEEAYADTVPQYVRIGIKYGSTASSSYTISFSGGVILGTAGNDGFSEIKNFDQVGNVTVSLQPDNSIIMTAVDQSGASVVLNQEYPTANCLMPADYNSGGTVNIAGSLYRGGVMFNSLMGTLNAINYIPVEEYLYGIINAELHKDYPLEALKAQAVAARSFTVCKLNTHNSYGFDLCDNTHCQMYKGYADEYPETTQAVDETKGETLKYEGKTVAAFYSKNSGGYTQASEDVWTAALGYLRAKKDEYSPAYKWEKTFSFSEIESKLSSAGYSIGTLTKVVIAERNQAGAVGKLQFVGTSDTVTVTKDRVRTILGGTYIKSTMFTLNGIYEETSGNGSSAYNVNGNIDSSEVYGIVSRSSQTEKLDERIYVIGAEGISSRKKLEGLYVSNGSRKLSIGTALQEEADTDKNGGQQGNVVLVGEDSSSGPQVTFTGLGYGHGVGLSQDGAVEMAKKGFTYRDILQYYYTDVTIEK